MATFHISVGINLAIALKQLLQARSLQPRSWEMHSLQHGRKSKLHFLWSTCCMKVVWVLRSQFCSFATLDWRDPVRTKGMGLHAVMQYSWEHSTWQNHTYVSTEWQICTVRFLLFWWNFFWVDRKQLWL